MDYELKNKLVKIISKNILTPVIYMIENDNIKIENERMFNERSKK